MWIIVKIYDPMENPFFIIHQKYNKSYQMENRHYHNHYELYYLLKGERHYFINDRSYHVKSGDIVLINKNYLHRTSNAADYRHEKIMIYFKEHFLMDLFNQQKMVNLFSIFDQKSNVIRLNIKNKEMIENILFKILDEYNQYQNIEREETTIFTENGLENQTYQANYQVSDLLFHLKLMLTELLYSIKKIIEKEKEDFEHTSPLHETISNIARYINLNYKEDIDLNSTADIFSLNPCYLSSVFKEISGFSFIEYLSLARIKEAKRLLKSSKLSITEISEEVGFNTLSHFGRVFKKYNGISPSKYRKS